MSTQMLLVNVPTSVNHMCVCIIDVQQEKQHNQLIQSVEDFDTDKLRKTETVEKGVLPNAEGNSIPT